MIKNKCINLSDFIGRLLLGGFFAYAGIGKILGFSSTAGWMESMGLPIASFLLVLVIILELFGGMALILGIKVRFFSALLAGFVVIATFIFHSPFDPSQILYFNKNMMITGGLLILAANTPKNFSLSKLNKYLE